MRFAKKILMVVLSFLLMLSTVSVSALANNGITVTINGQAVVFADQQPIIIDGRTLVPVGEVFRALGFTPSWDGSAQTATLTNDEYVIVITIGDVVFTTNGVNHTLDVSAQIINGRTMLPIRAVLESVNYELDWDSATRTVVITSSTDTATPPIITTPAAPVSGPPTVSQPNTPSTNASTTTSSTIVPVELISPEVSDMIRTFLGTDFYVESEFEFTTSSGWYNLDNAEVSLKLRTIDKLNLNDFILRDDVNRWGIPVWETGPLGNSGDTVTPTDAGDIILSIFPNGGWQFFLDLGRMKDVWTVRNPDWQPNENFDPILAEMHTFMYFDSSALLITEINNQWFDDFDFSMVTDQHPTFTSAFDNMTNIRMNPRRHFVGYSHDFGVWHMMDFDGEVDIDWLLLQTEANMFGTRLGTTTGDILVQRTLVRIDVGLARDVAPESTLIRSFPDIRAYVAFRIDWTPAPKYSPVEDFVNSFTTSHAENFPSNVEFLDWMFEYHFPGMDATISTDLYWTIHLDAGIHAEWRFVEFDRPLNIDSIPRTMLREGTADLFNTNTGDVILRVGDNGLLTMWIDIGPAPYRGRAYLQLLL